MYMTPAVACLDADRSFFLKVMIAQWKLLGENRVFYLVHRQAFSYFNND